MLYKVTNKYGRGHEQELKKFQTIDEAKAFIADELRNAAALKVNVLIRLYEGMDLLEEFDPTKPHELLREDEQTGTGGTGSGGKTSGASFKPTPFNMSPTPKGLPKHWLKDEDEENDKNGKK